MVTMRSLPREWRQKILSDPRVAERLAVYSSATILLMDSGGYLANGADVMKAQEGLTIDQYLGHIIIKRVPGGFRIYGTLDKTIN